MLAPVLSWQTTSRGLPARTKMLTIAGLDVAAAAGGNSYGVDPGSIQVKETAAGGVSRLEFTITDPQGVLAMQALDPVVFWDITRDQPIFRGWVQRSPTRRLGVGRSIRVTCIGIEAILDWAYVPAFTLASGIDLHDGLQALISRAVGLNGTPIRWASDTTGTLLSTVAYPVCAEMAGFTSTVAYTVAAGTLRQALQTYLAFCNSQGDIAGTGGTFVPSWWISVDFWAGIRIWWYDAATDPRAVAWSGGPFDYGGITFDPAGGIGTARPSGTEYEIDAGSVPRTAVVTGPGGAVTTVADGTGLPGPVITRTDTNLTSADLRAAVGRSMLSGLGGVDTGASTAEGTLNLGTFALQIRPGSTVDIVDPQAGLPGHIATWAGSIHKEFAPSGEETWRVEFGSKRARTATGLLRRLAQGELA